MSEPIEGKDYGPSVKGSGVQGANGPATGAIAGRWTLYGADDAGFTYYQGKTTPKGRVPVVPCDDAAVERGVNAVVIPYGWDRESAREIVEAVLRAAGETP